MSNALKIGIAGLGTVGMGVVDILHNQADVIAKRCGRPIAITAVSARDRNKKRGAGIKLDHLNWYTNAVELAMDADVDVVVELIGGDSGVAYDLCERALKDGKHVVTANKALIAKHGKHLAAIAEDKKVSLAFEASVAGGIPVIKTLKEALAGNVVSKVLGIMNGTCNYILTTMQETGRSFDDVLKEAQNLGYAEAEPSFDVDGIDTAHKLAILTALASGAPANFSTVHIEGIRGHVGLTDIRYAQELGYKIKLLGLCSVDKDGVRQYVYPAMVPLEHPLAHVDGVNNAIFIEGSAVGKLMMQGPGAGRGATASAVVADIIDIAAGRHSFAFGIPVAEQKVQKFSDITHFKGQYYIRIEVKDKPGVLADISDILRDEKVSMDSILQKGSKGADMVNIVGITHETTETKMIKTVAKIQKLATVLTPPNVLRIEAI